jgi:hypothetical protein
MIMVGEILLIIFSFALVLSGLAGILLPFLPGVPLAWFGMLLFAYATNFAVLTWKILLLFLGFSLLTFVTDMLAPLIGAKKYNASSYGMYGAMIGLLSGIFLLGPIGILAGPVLGAIIGEMAFGKTPEEALESSKGVLIGFLAGSAIKISLILVMLGYMIRSLF